MSSLLAVFMIFTLMIGKENQWFSKQVIIKASVPSANNLRTGSMVQLQGIKIGSVDAIIISSPNEVTLSLEIDQEFLKWIKTDSTVDIVSQGLVGDKMLKINSGSTDAPMINFASDVLKAHPSLQRPDISETGGEIAETAERVMSKLDLLLDQLNHDMSVSKAVKRMSSAAAKLDTMLSDMEKRGFSKKMSSAMDGLDKAMNRVNTGPGTMHSLIYQQELYDRMNQIVGGAGRSDVLKYFIRRSLDEDQN